MATHSQYSCLENPMDRGAWLARVHGVIKSWTGLKPLSMHACAFISKDYCNSHKLRSLKQHKIIL